MSGFLVTLHPTAKKAIRAEVKGRMKSLSLTYINEMSSVVTSKLIEHPTYSLSKALCIYLSMAGEIQTYDIVQHAFDSGKRVFIPKVTGKNSADMFMLEVHSYSQIESFPKSSWGIPEPPIELVKDSVDATTLGIIDTVIVPGVAFDNSCGRIGHGKGYYDCFLERLFAGSSAAGQSSVPSTIGLALDEQIVGDVPVEPHDRSLDFILTPSTLITKPETP